MKQTYQSPATTFVELDPSLLMENPGIHAVSGNGVVLSKERDDEQGSDEGGSEWTEGLW